jgi:hypothetical protein
VSPERVVSSAEMERMMKVQEVILKAMAGSLKWWEAAEIIGVTANRSSAVLKLTRMQAVPVSICRTCWT